MSEVYASSRVLVVDDEEANVRLLDRILRQAGCTQIFTAMTVQDAIATFATSRPDIVLLDFHLPDGNGLQVLEAIKKMLAADDYVPVLMLTGDTSIEVKRQALTIGARDFIGKPFELSETLLRIRNHLETRWLHVRVRDENALLDVRVRERTRELEEARTETLERLVHAAEYRDDTTGQHAKRVGELAGLLALACGQSKAEAEIIRRAAPLHDVGKVGIPDAILCKPGSLTREEFEVIMTHSMIGSKILAGSRSAVLKTAEEIARCHHERWDGTGYPVGLKGEEIPFPARIVAVVDFYDALSSDRPYRKAWPRERIAAEIQRQRGLQFDPRIADSFLDIVAGFGHKRAA